MCLYCKEDPCKYCKTICVELKTCRLDCKKEKCIEAFSFRNERKGTRGTWCKDCMKVYDKKRHQEQAPKIKLQKKINRATYSGKNRIKTWNYFIDNPCIDCGETNPIFLSFDHVRGRKSYNISERIDNTPWETLLKEIAKCVVRCLHCHHIKTASDSDYWSLRYLNKYGVRKITEEEIETSLNLLHEELSPLVQDLKVLDKKFSRRHLEANRLDEELVLKTSKT
jgi:hypothetical protein